MQEESVFKTFIAFTFDEQSQDNLYQLQLTLKPRLKTVRWMRPHQFHVTAAYLDMVTLEHVTKAAIAIKDIQAQFTPLKAKITSLDGFPSKQSSKIIYASLGGNNLIYFLDVVKKIRQTLVENTIDYDAKPFIPHITLGRAKIPQNISTFKHVSALRVPQGRLSNKITISSVAVFISQKTDNGFEYKEIKI